MLLTLKFSQNLFMCIILKLLVSVLDNLLGKESLVDVTLAAEGRILRVHRLVLCACSQYFEVSTYWSNV